VLKIALCSVALTVLTTVDVDFTTSTSSTSGSFVATDSNDDGLIEQDEVTSFQTNLLGTSTLLSFGDYDIATNTWSKVSGYYYLATSSDSETLLGATGSVTTTAVPEPATLSMFAFGAAALGLMARRRRVR